MPLTTARHSKQIPIPHNGPRGSPVIDILHGRPAIMRATATVAPGDTETGVPFTVIVNSLDMRVLRCGT